MEGYGLCRKPITSISPLVCKILMVTLIRFNPYECNQEKFNWYIGSYGPENKWVSPAYWLGPPHIAGEIGASPLLSVSRAELWELLNSSRVGLPRYYRNIRKGLLSNAARASDNVHVRVLPLIYAAQSYNFGKNLYLIYDCPVEHAQMIAGAIQWVADRLQAYSDHMRKFG